MLNWNHSAHLSSSQVNHVTELIKCGWLRNDFFGPEVKKIDKICDPGNCKTKAKSVFFLIWWWNSWDQFTLIQSEEISQNALCRLMGAFPLPLFFFLSFSLFHFSYYFVFLSLLVSSSLPSISWLYRCIFSFVAFLQYFNYNYVSLFLSLAYKSLLSILSISFLLFLLLRFFCILLFHFLQWHLKEQKQNFYSLLLKNLRMFCC